MRVNSINIGFRKRKRRKDSFSWLRYWKSLNFSPDSDGATNVAALNQALTDKRYVKIVTSGVYDFDSTILIPSNTTLEVCEGVTFRKEAGADAFSYIIGNKGMLTRSEDTNINVYGNGLVLDVNGIDTYSTVDDSISIIPRLRGVLTFFKVSNFVIDDIKIDDIDIEDQYALHLNDCHFGAITNLDFYLYKDCADIMSCSDIVFDGIKFYSSDDNFFIGIGACSTTDTIKDTERITIKNIEVGCPVVIAGWVARFYNASWDAWESAKDYENIKYCNNDGKIYGRTDALGEPTISANAPVHESGAVTGADGITWWRLYGDLVTKADVKDITFENVTLTSNRQCFTYKTISGIDNASIIDDIIIDNIVLPENHAQIFNTWDGTVGDVVIKNSSLKVTTPGSMFKSNTFALLWNKMQFDNCIIDSTTGTFMNLDKDGAEIDEIEFIDSSLDCTGQTMFSGPDSSTIKINKLTATRSNIKYVGAYLILVRENQFNVCQFTDTVFDYIKYLAKIMEAGAEATITLTNCEFKTSLSYCLVCSTYEGLINFVSRGTKYINPASYLFYCTSGDGDIVIDVLNSSGTITNTKVRNGANVHVTNCDIPYV